MSEKITLPERLRLGPQIGRLREPDGDERAAECEREDKADGRTEDDLDRGKLEVLKGAIAMTNLDTKLANKPTLFELRLVGLCVQRRQCAWQASVGVCRAPFRNKLFVPWRRCPRTMRRCNATVANLRRSSPPSPRWTGSSCLQVLA